LKNAGLNAYLVGNIGNPILNLLHRAKTSDYFVYELSCHQLYGLKKSPHISVLLNIFPEHLDYYKTFKEYADSKSSIAKYQSKDDYLVFDSENKTTKLIAQKSKAKKIPINIKNISKIISIKNIPLLGEHNLKNVSAAIEVAKILKIPNRKIALAIKKFKPLEHRLEKVGTHKGITFYNDALATIPEATIGAIDALGKDVQTIMLGGFDRNIKFESFAKKILDSKIQTVILFPTTGEKIWKCIAKKIKKRRIMKHFFVDNMSDAVKIAYKNTDKGKICLLSTACTSFSIFKDYREKGEAFKKYVKIYGN
jgi:UDP-N-acetylmuramoylalanine--D-glutamate ligase